MRAELEADPIVTSEKNVVLKSLQVVPGSFSAYSDGVSLFISCFEGLVDHVDAKK